MMDMKMQNEGWTEVKTEPVFIELDPNNKISYYLNQLTEDATGTVKYELHGNCWAWAVDTSSWVSGNDKFTCDMGLYYDAAAIVDWQTIDMVWGGENGSSSWSCKDGKSTDATSFVYTEDASPHCMANSAKSSATYPSAGTGIFQSHWMRPFVTNDSEDLVLELNKNLPISIRISLGSDVQV